MSENSSIRKITDPERIIRILRKLAGTHISVFLRTDKESSVLIRGSLAGLEYKETKENHEASGLFINDLSPRAVSSLEGKRQAILEFVFISGKVTAECQIKQLQNSSILLTIPTCFYNLERRKNARFLTHENKMAYLQIPTLTSQDLSHSMPLTEPYEKYKSILSVTDISSNGLCALSHFPFAHATLKKGWQDEHTLLYLPMQPPIQLKAEIAWSKAVKEAGQDGLTHFHTFRYGIMYQTKNEQDISGIKRFIQQLNESGAI